MKRNYKYDHHAGKEGDDARIEDTCSLQDKVKDEMEDKMVQIAKDARGVAN